MIKTTLKIDGMMCSMCEAHICEAIRKAVPAAKKVTASRGRKEASFLTESAVDAGHLKAAIDAKEDFRDIGQAAMLAKVSGKSFKEILAMHKSQSDWKAITKSLGISHAQMREARLEMRAMHIAQKGLLAQDKALALLKNGYQSRDTNMAAILAKESGKDIQAVLDMKKINNRWTDVAGQLGVDKSKLRPEGSHHGGPQGGPPPAMPGDRAQE